MPFSVAFCSEEFNGVQLGQSAALYCRVSTADQTCARQEFLAGASLVSGRYPAIERCRLSQLNPIELFAAKGHRKGHFVWQSAGPLKVYFNRDDHAHNP